MPIVENPVVHIEEFIHLTAIATLDLAQIALHGLAGLLQGGDILPLQGRRAIRDLAELSVLALDLVGDTLELAPRRPDDFVVARRRVSGAQWWPCLLYTSRCV